MVTRIASFKASTKFKQMELAAAAADSPVMSNWLEARREVWKFWADGDDEKPFWVN